MISPAFAALVPRLGSQESEEALTVENETEDELQRHDTDLKPELEVGQEISKY